MAEEIAMKERNPQERRWRGPVAAIGTAALGLAALFGISKLTGTGEPRPVDNTPTPSAAASLPPEKTPLATPTIEPTVKPTEKPLTDQEKIELTRKAQQEALAKGQIMFPVPEIKDGQVTQSNLIAGQEIDLFISAPANQEVLFPALISGKIIRAGEFSRAANMITISIGDKNLSILFPSSAQIIVKEGDSVSLGDPLFKVSNNPNSSIQKTFDSIRAKDGQPQGAIAIIGARDTRAGVGQGFEQLTIDRNVLKDTTGKPLTISAVQK